MQESIHPNEATLCCFYFMFVLFCAFQVKPLLQVTRQDEEIQVREAQLQKANENLVKIEQNYSELDRKHIQVVRMSTLFLPSVHPPL